ncbi:MAG TPA: dTDP-4-dehydrorhamnose 3,5-epimerase [Proteobacteria bacterium]|nr:dTDP-4-dehydrorhamnose 3,5-epimerase [Pseudomonadota bacterium]
MKILQTPLQNAFVLEPEPFADDRGKFARIYCHEELKEIGHYKPIVQINHSLTRQKGAVRGMHFQYPPKVEIKMVKCINGSVYDVIIDLRRNSSTFLRWYGEILSAENIKMIYVPEGLAHGFQVLEANSELLYFHTEFYSPEHEGGVRYNDPLLNISWPLEVADVSTRDQNHPLLSEDFEGIEF